MATDPVPFITINGKKCFTLAEGMDAVREAWREFKKPLIAEQMAKGGPKKTDPAPVDTTARRRGPRGL